MNQMDKKINLKTHLTAALLDGSRMPCFFKVGGNGDGISRLEFWLILLAGLFFVGHYMGLSLYIGTLMGVAQ